MWAHAGVSGIHSDGSGPSGYRLARSASPLGRGDRGGGSASCRRLGKSCAWRRRCSRNSEALEFGNPRSGLTD